MPVKQWAYLVDDAVGSHAGDGEQVAEEFQRGEFPPAEHSGEDPSRGFESGRAGACAASEPASMPVVKQ